MNYLEDLKIDISNIHNIVDTHAVVSMQYHELYCDKLDELNEQKRQLQLKKVDLEESYAKIYLENKKRPDKITEKENESLIFTNPEYKIQQEKYFNEIKKLNDIEKQCNILEGVVKNMQARKNMIEEKTKLISMGIGNIKQPEQTKNALMDKLNKKE